MNTASPLQHCASEFLEAARCFQAATEAPGSHVAAPDSLTALEEALQTLSAAWYQVAADAAPGIMERRRARGSERLPRPRPGGLLREQEAHLMGTLQDVAAAFAHCARACREARSTATPIIARRVAATRGPDRPAEDGPSWFEGRQPPTERVA